MRRVIGVMGVMFLMAAGTAALALPAGAQAIYPPTSCSLQLASGATASAGSTLGVSGTGFAADSVVTLAVNGESVGQATASGAGTINTTIAIPSNATSPATISATPPGCSLTVALSAGAATRPLAFTGSDSEPLVIAGIVALALGAALVFGARRRSGTRAAAEAVSTTV